MDPAGAAGRALIVLVSLAVIVLSLAAVVNDANSASIASLIVAFIVGGAGLRAAMPRDFFEPGRSVGGGVLLASVPLLPGESVAAEANGAFCRSIKRRGRLWWCRVFLTDRRLIAVPYRFTFQVGVPRVALADIVRAEARSGNAFLTDGMLGAALTLHDNSVLEVFAANDDLIQSLRTAAPARVFSREAATDFSDVIDGLAVAGVWLLLVHGILFVLAIGWPWLLVFVAGEALVAVRVSWLWLRRPISSGIAG